MERWYRMNPSASDGRTSTDLLARVQCLRTVVRREGAQIYALWRGSIVNRRFGPGARNLAAYLALRRHDISDLQPALAAYGLSSLGRSEAHVMAALDALCATLAHIAGSAPGNAYPPPGRMRAGIRALRAAQNRFFGRDTVGTNTRIMVTLPTEAASENTLVAKLIDAGMTCARINCAHDNAAIWRAMAVRVRSAAAAAGRECRILMDVGGPKCRVETVHANEKVRLFRGDRIALVREMANASATDAVIVTINFAEILDILTPGNEVWIDDGKI